ncbi:hypothetical protein BH23DEI1_BH23DEI1_14840 [soil metagenome]
MSDRNDNDPPLRGQDDNDPPLRGQDVHHSEGRADALAGDERSEEELRGDDETDEIENFTREEFMDELSLEAIGTITGLPVPSDPSPDEERQFRGLAWENVKLDVGSRQEWGGVLPDRQVDEDPPERA